MSSASHNVYSDNGIKLFAADGLKSDAVEAAIEAMIAAQDFSFAHPAEIGKIYPVENASGRYIEFVKSTIPKNLSFEKLKVVIDCAHGAAYKVGPSILWELGAQVIPIGITPTGININANCGVTSLDAVCQAVVEHKADIGIVLDGDADRLIIINERGGILDGDQIMALLATAWLKEGRLKGGGIIATHMSNSGLQHYFDTKSLKLIRTDVGDHHVIKAMLENGYNIGGEQSGHIILTDYGFTGDGLVAALQILKIVMEKNQPASQVCQVFEPIPQVLENVSITNADKVLEDPSVIKVLQEAEKTLIAARGRLFVRKSGTESVIRIMAESDDPQALQSIVRHIGETMRRVK
jgi:phosphoglucosamine mutase